MEALKMKKRQMKTVIAALLVLLVPKPGLAYSRSNNDPAGSRSQRFLTPDQEFIVAFNSAKALPHLASARKDIVTNNIPGAQSEVGQALTLVDQMKSRFPVIRLEELIAAAGYGCLTKSRTGIGVSGIDYACAGEYTGACGFERSNGALERAKAF
jgi:hypothetical protein